MANKKTKKNDTLLNGLSAEENNIILRAQQEIVESDKSKVFEIIENRKQELTEKTKRYCEEKGIRYPTYTVILAMLTEGNSYVNVKYTPQDMAVWLEWYKELTVKLQGQIDRHTPSVYQFCQIIGISSKTYDQMLISEDSQMVEIMTKIEDYIKDQKYYAGLNGIVQKDILKHELETVHKQVVVKKTETTTITHNESVDDKMRKWNAVFKKDKVVDAEFTEIEGENDEDESEE